MEDGFHYKENEILSLVYRENSVSEESRLEETVKAHMEGQTYMSLNHI